MYPLENQLKVVLISAKMDLFVSKNELFNKRSILYGFLTNYCYICASIWKYGGYCLC